ncbi:uncharacterized protein [Oryctolagus cuniculus]|uniref:uncharacterized protein isoform X2 n=1 Tax=Oryctolagus cuniculus TaxID=9986 RepID=UPI00387972FB
MAGFSLDPQAPDHCVWATLHWTGLAKETKQCRPELTADIPEWISDLELTTGADLTTDLAAVTDGVSTTELDPTGDTESTTAEYRESTQTVESATFEESATSSLVGEATETTVYYDTFQTESFVTDDHGFNYSDEQGEATDQNNSSEESDESF